MFLSAILSAILALAVFVFLKLIKDLEKEKSALLEESLAKENTIQNFNRNIISLEAKNYYQEEQMKKLESEKHRLDDLLELSQRSFNDLNSRMIQLESQLNAKEEQIKLQKESFEQMRSQTKTEFENIANQILETKSKIFIEEIERLITHNEKMFK